MIGPRRLELTKNATIVKSHYQEMWMDFPMDPPPSNGVPDLFDSLAEIIVQLVKFLNTIHRNIKEVNNIYIIIGLGLCLSN